MKDKIEANARIGGSVRVVALKRNGIQKTEFEAEVKTRLVSNIIKCMELGNTIEMVE